METFFIEGTFEVVLKPYTQLYTIHGDIGSDAELTKVTHFVYALLVNKLQSTYTTMFNCLKENVRRFQPKDISFHMKSDFERGVINAFR